MKIYIQKSRFLLAAIFLLWAFACPSKALLIFEDDFEGGNLDLWTISGRQFGMANTAGVVDEAGSKMGYLYHKGFTEISIEKIFDFDETLAFSFDFKAEVTGADYASGEAVFYFQDENQKVIGTMGYIKATSDYIFDYFALSTNVHFFSIPDQAGLESYVLNVQDLLSNITIDEDLISSVRLRFNAYSSVNQNGYVSQVWIDNVSVTSSDPVAIPEPATVILLVIGAAVSRKRK